MKELKHFYITETLVNFVRISDAEIYKSTKHYNKYCKGTESLIQSTTVIDARSMILYNITQV